MPSADCCGMRCAAGCASIRPAGVLMSGGLDSTSVACLAAEEMARASQCEPLRVFSWVFDELAVLRRTLLHGRGGRALRPRGAPHRGDTLWPLRDAPAWPQRSGPPPPLGIYRLLLENLCREIKGDRNRCASHGELRRSTSTLAPSDGSSSCCAKAGPWLGSAAYCCVSRGVEWRGLRSDPGLRRLASRLLQPFRGQRRPAGCPPMQSPGSRPRRWTAFQGPSHATRMALARLTALPADRNPVGRAECSARHGPGKPPRDRGPKPIPRPPARRVHGVGATPPGSTEAVFTNTSCVRRCAGSSPTACGCERRPLRTSRSTNRGVFERERDNGPCAPRCAGRLVAALRSGASGSRARFREPLRPRDDGAAALVPWFCVVVELWRRHGLAGGAGDHEAAVIRIRVGPKPQPTGPPPCARFPRRRPRCGQRRAVWGARPVRGCRPSRVGTPAASRADSGSAGRAAEVFHGPAWLCARRARSPAASRCAGTSFPVAGVGEFFVALRGQQISRTSGHLDPSDPAGRRNGAGTGPDPGARAARHVLPARERRPLAGRRAALPRPLRHRQVNAWILPGRPSGGFHAADRRHHAGCDVFSGPELAHFPQFKLPADRHRHTSRRNASDAGRIPC